MAQLSKADQIRKLLHLSNAVIAERMGCSDAYVRAVRQRTRSDGRPQWTLTGLKWVEKNRERVRARKNARHKERYQSDPEYRRRQLEATKRWQLANREHRLAYERKRRAEARAS